MSFMGIMGASLALNLIRGLFSKKPAAVTPAYYNNMSKTMAKHHADMQKIWDKPVQSKKFALDLDIPNPPEGAITRLAQKQENHESQRTAFLNKFQNDLRKTKEDFFAKNHYETKTSSKDNPKLALKNSQPIIQKGKETPIQKVARGNFENTQKAEMFSRHATEKQNFVQEQKNQIVSFLDSNKFQLANPGVQSELSKVIMTSQKKALKLQQDHEDEYYKIDLPLKEMREKVDKNLLEYREMEKQQAKEEENSPEARQLASYQADLVSLLDAKRAEVREQKKSEMFLLDPRKVLKQGLPKQDASTVLPMNIVAALEDFGISSLPS